MKRWRGICWTLNPLSCKSRAVSTKLSQSDNVGTDDNKFHVVSDTFYFSVSVCNCCASSSNSCHTESFTSKNRFLKNRFQNWSLINFSPKLNLTILHLCCFVFVLSTFWPCSFNVIVHVLVLISVLRTKIDLWHDEIVLATMRVNIFFVLFACFIETIIRDGVLTIESMLVDWVIMLLLLQSGQWIEDGTPRKGLLWPPMPYKRPSKPAAHSQTLCPLGARGGRNAFD